ncbi:HtaA domain-containing protein [Streptomyces fulvoviolaceus]|uniref:HtaA domain-containing protein n=1 Tax=Streptomyces fulvoviolaceus TaxID=285535 RepID=UPI0004CAE407|nr:HtaA domain-containing protein [Streptomyces fulvoviolaceus]
MAKRPGAAALAGGTLLALLSPGAAAAQDGESFPRAVSGGYASWTTTDAELTDRGVSVDVAEPAVRGPADRAWFPATGGGTDPETGDAEVELAGTAQLTGPAQPLPLGGLRLELAGSSGSLSTRTVIDGTARELALADVALGDATLAVRASGVTWTGLRASLTDEGARLLSEWSGQEFAAGDALGLFDLTVGTGGGETPEVPARPEETPQPSPSAATPEKQQQAALSAAVAHAGLAAGGEQAVTGAGFEPGEVVLVSIDEDTRYQTVADEEGRVSRTFPVYATAADGAHTVELYAATGGRRAVTQFEVMASD